MSLLSANLEAFQAIVQNQTVHGAAKSIGLTQTGVTQRIRALEKDLSTTLFIRSRKGMTLTPEGRALLRYCQAARDLEGQTLSQIRGAGKTTAARVCITGPTSIMASRIIPQIFPLHRQFSDLVFTFNISDLDQRIETLRQGQIQFALVPPESVAREMDSKLLKPEKYLLVGPKSWKSRKIKEIVRAERIIDFDPSDTMTFQYLKKFGLLDLARPDRHFVNQNSSLISLFAAGLGYGVLTQEVAESALSCGDITALNGGAAFESRQALAWYPRPEMPPYLKAVISAIS